MDTDKRWKTINSGGNQHHLPIHLHRHLDKLRIYSRRAANPVAASPTAVSISTRTGTGSGREQPGSARHEDLTDSVAGEA